jgi:MFS family permease
MNKTRILFTTSLVSSLIMLDSNIVVVLLPVIGRTFHASFTEMEWGISSYLLAFAALLMAAGAFADLRGRKMAMVIGLFVFAGSSAACGLASSPLILKISPVPCRVSAGCCCLLQHWRSSTILLVIATFICIKESKDPTAKRLDWAGIITFSPGLLLFIWALMDGNDTGWGSPKIVGRLAGAIALIVIFVYADLALCKNDGHHSSGASPKRTL